MINPGYQVLLETEDGVQYDPWDEWGLALCSREIEAPEVQTHLVEIPGRDGYLDLTETLDGYVHYYNREVSLEFKALTRDGFFDAYGEFATITHGQKIKIYFPDESDLYFYGRCTLDKTELSNDSSWGGYITLIADCDPYRYDPTGETTTTVSLASLSSMTLDLEDVWGVTTPANYYGDPVYQCGDEDGVSTPCKAFTKITITLDSDTNATLFGPVITDSDGRWTYIHIVNSIGGDDGGTWFVVTLTPDSDGLMAIDLEAEDDTDGYKYVATPSTEITFAEINTIRVNIARSQSADEVSVIATTLPGAVIDIEGVLNHPTPTVYSTVSGLILTDLDSFWELDEGNNVCEGLLIPEDTYRLYVFLGEDMDEDDVDEDDYVSITYTGGTL